MALSFAKSPLAGTEFKTLLITLGDALPRSLTQNFEEEGGGGFILPSFLCVSYMTASLSLAVGLGTCVFVCL